MFDDGFEDLVHESGSSAVGEWWRRRGATAEVLAVGVREEDMQGEIDSSRDGIFPSETFRCDIIHVDEIDLDRFIGFIGQLNDVPDTVDALVGQIPSLAVQFSV